MSAGIVKSTAVSPQTIRLSARRNKLWIRTEADLPGEELAEVAGEVGGFFFGDEVAAVGDRAALGVSCDSAERFDDEIAAAARAAAAEAEGRHRKFETGGESRAIIGDVLLEGAIEI